MRTLQVILDNGKYAARLPTARALLGSEPVYWRSPERGAGAGELLQGADEATSRCLSSFWEPTSFWVPTQDPCGLPVIAVSSEALAQAYREKLTVEGVDVSVCFDVGQLGRSVFTNVCILVSDNCTASNPFFVWSVDWVDDEVVEWLARPWDAVGGNHCDAYIKYRTNKLLRTEDVWGKLGAWAWGELERLLAEVDRSGRGVDPVAWRRMWKALDEGKVGPALMWGDSLWDRQRRFKQRNYFDICSLFLVTNRVWGEAGCGEAFREVAEVILYQCVDSGMGYERMLFTCFWLWTTQYWQPLCEYALSSGILYATDKQWTAICKETTAMVTQSWMFPLTNRQCLASAYFLNAEDLIGFSDKDTAKGEITVEVLRYALESFEYTFAAGGEGKEGRSFEAYLVEMRQAAYSLLQPIYATFADKAQGRAEFMETRSAWGAGGVAGRRSRDVLGSHLSPPGCAKAYVMTMSGAKVWDMDWGRLYIEVAGKQDERGAERTLSATDMRDQAGESFAFHPLRNRYPMVGLDMGESPAETMARHLNLVSASCGPAHYLADGRVLVAWDWSKWDHFVHLAEHVVVLQAMGDLVRRYVREGVREEMLAELEYIERGHREAVFRSQVFADEQYGKIVDQVIADSAGRAQRLNDTSVLVRNPAGQQSGRRTTLEVNTIIGTSRLLVRDAELLGSMAHLRNRSSVYVLNRADDVAEVFSCYKKGVDAVNKMLEQGHRANPKKQVAQWRSIVYFRILYCNGAMRAFPPRAVYAACSGHPDKGSGSETSPVEKLRSVSSGLEMWARRGGWMGMAKALYDDARRFYSKTRVWTKESWLHGAAPKTTILDSRTLEAAPECGGMGILPVGVYEYDYSIKVGRGRYDEDEKWWKFLADGRALTMVDAPGLKDLLGHASTWTHAATGMKLTPPESDQFRKKWATGRSVQDGTGDVSTWLRNAAICAAARRAHVDEHSSEPRGSIETWPARAALLRFQQARDRSERSLGSDAVVQTLRDIRGPPAYAMFKSQFYGAASIIYENRKDPGVLRALAGGSALGRDYIAQSGFLPEWVKVEHLNGRLGAAGAWHKLIPASWAGWLDAAVNKGLYESCRASPRVYQSRMQLLLTRARLTKFAALLFRQAYPRLLLH
ncbi:RNA-dependent RNA polymerase [Fusarium solani alternavirus 1]|nr:RNA-dependent RNA polymerase [Fusarium solani alternavirus 1]